MNNKAKLKLIEALPYAKNDRRSKTYEYTIYGKTFNRNPRWWAKAKTIADGRPITAGVLYYRLNSSGSWTKDEALGAYSNETAREYRLRTGTERAKNLELDIKSSVIDTWLYSRPPQSL